MSDRPGPEILCPPMTGRSVPSHVPLWLALERSARWSPETLRRWHAARLDEVLRHAYGNVPLYSPRGRPPAVHEPEDLAAVEVLDAASVRAAPIEARLAMEPPPGTDRSTTSGSTGATAPVLHPPVLRRYLGASLWRRDRARGIRPLRRRARMGVGGSPGEAARVVGRRRLRLDAGAPPEALARAVERFEPHVLIGYPHLLAEIAGHLEVPLRAQAVTCFGEQLDPATRAELRAGFGVEPLDSYGANEFGPLAWQCREVDAYHLNHELVYVELVDDQLRPVPPGVLGHVLVTDLVNGLLPHIRYRVGDLAAWSTRRCRCGHRLPTFERIAGRQLDWLVGAGGARIAPERLWMDLLVPIEAMTGAVERYRVHQHVGGDVQVSVVPRGAWDEVFAASVREAYQRELGPEIVVRVVPVDHISRLSSGKFPMVTSEAARALEPRA